MPMLCYLTGICLGQELRQGNDSPGTRILEFDEGCAIVLPASYNTVNLATLSIIYMP